MSVTLENKYPASHYQQIQFKERGPNFGDCLSKGTGIWGPNWLGTICLGGPIFGGPFVHRDQIGWELIV